MVKNGYLMLPISELLDCKKVEDVVVKEGSGWLLDYMIVRQQLYSPTSKIAKIQSHIRKSSLLERFLTKCKQIITPENDQIILNTVNLS